MEILRVLQYLIASRVPGGIFIFYCGGASLSGRHITPIFPIAAGKTGLFRTGIPNKFRLQALIFYRKLQLVKLYLQILVDFIGQNGYIYSSGINGQSCPFPYKSIS